MLPKINGTLRFTDGHFTLGAVLSLSAECVDTSCLDAFALRSNITFAEAAQASLEIRLDEGFETEEYELNVAPGTVSVTARCPQGVILALTTLWQLADDNRRVPCGSIREKPRCAYRGLLLDCVRHYFDIGEIKRIIEQMALVKLNTLHWVLTNDQGWRMESRVYPKLNEDGLFYSFDEIRDIIAYASARGISIIPEIDMPGHMTALLHEYPEYSCKQLPVNKAVGGGVYPVILCAGRESTYTLIENLISEAAPLFPGPFIHIGGDEAPKREWEACPLCRDKMKRLELDSEQLQCLFMNRAAEILRRHGKTAICWNEALCGGNLDESALIQYWTVDKAQPAQAYAHRGGRVIYSDMFSLYLDYPHYFTPLERVYSDPQTIEELDISEGLYGMEACLWTERIETPQQLEKQLFPRLYALAEAAWCSERDYDDFKARLKAYIAKQDVCCCDEAEWDYAAADRVQRVQAFMRRMREEMGEEARSAAEETVSEPSGAFQKRFAEYFLGYRRKP